MTTPKAKRLEPPRRVVGLTGIVEQELRALLLTTFLSQNTIGERISVIQQRGKATITGRCGHHNGESKIHIDFSYHEGEPSERSRAYYDSGSMNVSTIDCGRWQFGGTNAQHLDARRLNFDLIGTMS